MITRLNLLLCAFAFMFLAACAGSKGGGYSSPDSEGGGGGGGYASPAQKANELKESRDEAAKLTEENHKMAREIFDLKNKMNLPTDED